MTYNVFGGTLNLAQSLDPSYRSKPLKSILKSGEHCKLPQRLVDQEIHEKMSYNENIHDKGSRSRILESTWKRDRCLKVLEFHSTGPWKFLNSSSQTVQYQQLCETGVLPKTRFANNIVTFCFYQLKLSCNHRNRYYVALIAYCHAVNFRRELVLENATSGSLKVLEKSLTRWLPCSPMGMTH